MKKQDTSPILYDPTPANAGPVWAWHAAPEWEKQAMEPRAIIDFRCGDANNKCNCEHESECGYNYVFQKIAQL